MGLLDARGMLVDPGKGERVKDLSKYLFFKMIRQLLNWRDEEEVWHNQLEVRFVDGHAAARELVHQ